MNCEDCKYSHDIGTALLCWGQRFAPPVDADHWCEGWRPKSVTPQTKADLIKSLSVEELAEYLSDIAGWLSEYEGKAHALLKWLKAPVEEVDNGT